MQCIISTTICGIFVVRGLRLHRALLRCVLQETAPRPGFGFPALPVLQCGILLFCLGLGFLSFPLLLTSDLGLHLHTLPSSMGRPLTFRGRKPTSSVDLSRASDEGVAKARV